MVYVPIVDYGGYGLSKTSRETPMDNGCPKCALLDFDKLCIDCRLEQAEHNLLRDMDIVEKLKKEKEQESANN